MGSKKAARKVVKKKAAKKSKKPKKVAKKKATKKAKPKKVAKPTVVDTETGSLFSAPKVTTITKGDDVAEKVAPAMAAVADHQDIDDTSDFDDEFLPSEDHDDLEDEEGFY